MTHPLDDKLNILWKEAQAVHEARKELLARIGEDFIRLEEIKLEEMEIQERIRDCKGKFAVLDSSCRSVTETLVKENGVPDGDFEIDFTNRRIVPKNGQISASSNR